MASGYEPILSGDGKLLLSHWPLDWVFVKRLQQWRQRKPWFLKKKYLLWAIHDGLVVPPTLPSFWKRKKRRTRKRSFQFFSIDWAIHRYREFNQNLEPNFHGNKDIGNSSKGIPCGKLKTFQNGTLVQTQNVFRTGTPGGSLASGKIWDVLHPGPPFRAGGPFASVKMQVPSARLWTGISGSSKGSSGFSSLNYKTYTGSAWDDGTWGSDSISSYLDTSIPVLSGYDTIAWDKLKPQPSPGNLSQFLYELRDLPKMLETTANLFWNSWRSFGGGYSKIVMHPTSVADNFLNHEFGWVPFLSDLQKLYSLYVNSSEYIAQTVKMNNTFVRKHRVLDQSDVQQLVMRGYTPGIDPFTDDMRLMCNQMTVDGIPCWGTMDITRRVKTRVWAEGSFKYYRPEFDDNLMHFGSQLSNVRRLMTIYGLRINPTVIWKLTPWTWAIDWFTNVGQFIQHHDEFVNDGIVSRYLFVMKSTERFVTKHSLINWKAGAQAFDWTRSHSIKQRKAADSPYGFDKPWQGLSGLQLGILGAIGITRTPSGFLSRG
uniref:Uncharacterized protein n=2 Tax=Leviviricetes TaxID=2842243 RepID=A0A514D8J9_9VIRU|nr:MAG: hypothetical protein H1Bulk29117_000004 [Leviviridae sp.]